MAQLFSLQRHPISRSYFLLWLPIIVQLNFGPPGVEGRSVLPTDGAPFLKVAPLKHPALPGKKTLPSGKSKRLTFPPPTTDPRLGQAKAVLAKSTAEPTQAESTAWYLVLGLAALFLLSVSLYFYAYGWDVAQAQTAELSVQPVVVEPSGNNSASESKKKTVTVRRTPTTKKREGAVSPKGVGGKTPAVSISQSTETLSRSSSDK